MRRTCILCLLDLFPSHHNNIVCCFSIASYIVCKSLDYYSEPVPILAKHLYEISLSRYNAPRTLSKANTTGKWYRIVCMQRSNLYSVLPSCNVLVGFVQYLKFPSLILLHHVINSSLFNEL